MYSVDQVELAALRDSSSALPRSGSIDSVVEASAVRVRRSEPSAGITLQIPRPERALSLASPAIGRRAKPHRALAGHKQGLNSEAYREPLERPSLVHMSRSRLDYALQPRLTYH
ncbi:unnamed protein product [Pieris brassicae]|uniref:Uncharacterized protein n=1 Tax=Pieris brassicae TaxID=7116 RepID=A0A9P0SG07_PIEBR|nr:unnamed protein product [Pieris brassicae]